jgi:hypothetical protein
MRARLHLGAVTVAALVATSALTGDEAHAPERLRDTGLYSLGRSFSPQYPLWTDGAAKTRWVYLPPGSTIDASEDADWDFPVGTRFWKEFSFDGRKAETRMLWKASAERWVAVSYLWNEDGTDAVLAPEKGASTAVEVAPGKRHSIPSRDECLMCHGTSRTGPLGFNALQLSPDRDPNAIHGEPLVPGLVTLETLVDERLISPERADLVAAPPRIRASDPMTRSVLGYLSTNCGSCHNGRGEIAALGPILKPRELLDDGDAVARRLVGQATRWQVPGTPEDTSVVIDPDRPEKSAMLVRMHSRRPSSQMPPLGTLMRDDEAVGVIARWVAELTRQAAPR